MQRGSQRRDGFTLVELLAVLLVTGLLIAFVLPWLRPARTNPAGMKCVNYLKNIGLAFCIYATDNDDLFPCAAPTNGLTAWAQQPYSAYLHFKALSNELSTPKIVVCPQDQARGSKLVDFSQVTGNNDVGYFVGLLRDETTPLGILAGDRDLTNSGGPKSGFLQLSTNSAIGWGQPFHRGKGNIVLGDGSVQQLNSFELDAAYKASRGMPDQLALPVTP